LQRWLVGEFTAEEVDRLETLKLPPEPERDDQAWWVHHRTGLGRRDVVERTFEKFQSRDRNTAEVKRLLEAWTPATEHGYMLYGTVGTGKSHLTKALLIKWASAPTKLKGSFVTVAALMDQLRTSFDSGPDSFTSLEIMARFSSPEILVLDDLGAEKTTDWVQEKFLSLLDQRLSLHLATFLTSNLSAEELGRRYDGRILDRLKELVVFLRVDGPSFRNAIYAGRKT